jgi:hypothetical protein
MAGVKSTFCNDTVFTENAHWISEAVLSDAVHQ